MGEAALTFTLVMTVGIWKKGEERETSDLKQHQEANPLLRLGGKLVARLYCIKFLLLVAGGWEGKDGHENGYI